MAVLKQIAVMLIGLAVAGLVWLHFADAPGRFLLARGDLPPFVRAAVSRISPADDPAKVGATSGRGKRDADNAVLVVADTAVPAVTRSRLRAIGTGEAERTVAVYPEATGIVSGVNFRSGDAVEAGSVLAALQSDSERVEVDRARLALAAAQRQQKRYEALSSASSVTSAQVDEARRAADAAALDVQAAEIALAKRNIVAPISGRVGLVAIENGALVSNGTLIATVDDRSRLRVRFNAPEAFVPELAVGHKVMATPTTRSGRTFDGVISAIDSRLDAASRTLLTEALIDNADDQLRPGMSFNVEVEFPGESFLSVDPLAVQWERAGAFVWVLRADKPEKATVSIVERNVDRVLVASDTLKEGDRVVTEGAQQVREGTTLRVQEPTAVPAAPAAPDGNAAPTAALARPADAISGTAVAAELSADAPGTAGRRASPVGVAR